MDATTPKTDEDLFLRYQSARDCAALGVLFHRRAKELLRLAVFLAPRPTEAEDLVQATFLSAIAHADQFRPDGRVMSWLCGILTNHARMLRRNERRKSPAARDQVTEDPADAALHAELRAALGRGIDELPEPYRSVVSLHLREGLDSQEIGARLQRPAATVRKQMERALDRLRVALPMGLAAALAARADAAALASRAAEAAQFVEPATAVAAPPRAVASAPPGGVAALAVAAVAGLAAALWLWPDERVSAPTDRTGVAPATSTGAPPPTVAAATVGDGRQPAAADRSPAAAAGLANLTVECVDGAGLPLIDLDVLAVPDDGRTLAERLLDPAAARTARTDADGRAMFAALAEGVLDLTVPGSPGKRQTAIAAGANFLRLELPRPQQLAGMVVDANGRGIAGAELIASETGLRGDLGHAFARTAADGSFRGSTHVTTGRVVARRAGYQLGLGARIEASGDLRFVLQPAATGIDVTVVDADGAAVADAYVALVPRSQVTSLVPTQHARTNGDGRCALLDPGVGEATLVARAHRGAPGIVDVPRGRTSIRLQLPRGHAVTGRLLRSDGAAFPKALITCTVPDLRTNEPASPLALRQTRTDDDGRFAIADMPAGPVVVRAFDGATGGPGLPRIPKLVAAAEAKAGEATEVPLVAKEPAMLRGQLVGPDGRGLGAWTVLATPVLGSTSHRQFRSRSASTDGDGWFTVHDLATGEHYVLGAARGADALDGNLVPQPVGQAAAGEAGLRLVADPAAPGHALQCRVLDAAGNVPAEVQLELRLRSMPWSNLRTLGRDGVAAWTDLPPGDYLLTVHCAGHGPATREVTVATTDARTDLGTLTLAPPARAVVRLHGPGVRAGLRVVARPTPGDKLLAASFDGLGVAELPPLPPGSAELLVHGAGIAPVRRIVALPAGTSMLDWDVAAAAGVPIQVTFPPAENPFTINGPLHVQFFTQQGELVFEDYPGATRERGLFDCSTGLAAGSYRIVARSLWNTTASATFAVPERGLAAPVRLHLVR